MNAATLRVRLIHSGLARPENICGCSSEELDRVAQVAGRELPTPYREFMKSFGRKAGRFLRDIEIFYPAVLKLRPVAEEIVRDLDDPNLELPRSAFVFAMRYEEQFMFFDNDGDDPPVMHYFSGWPAFKRIADSFWNVIFSELDLAEANYAIIKGTPYDLRPE